MNQKNYPNLSLIVAVGQNREIGYQQNLIWRIDEDLNFFKETTMNSYIIMGKNTYYSMPKNLKGRKYIVLSRSEDFVLPSPKIHCHNVSEVLEFSMVETDSAFFVIGGEMIYKEFLPYINRMYITEIEDTYPLADTFFPYFSVEDWDKSTGKELYCTKNKVYYKHSLYLKK